MMYRSTYISYTTVIPLFTYPLEEQNTDNIRGSFKPLFGKEYNNRIRPNDNEEVSYKFFKYKSEWPFFKNLGCVKFVYPTVGNYKLNDFFKTNEISDKKKEVVFRFSPFKDNNPDDQRMTLLYYALQTPLYIAAYEKGKCVVTGRIFVRLYSCGFLAISIGLTLPTHRFPDFNRVLPVVELLSPGNCNSKVPWKWESKIGNGSLYDIVENVKQLIAGSVYESGTFPDEHIVWHKSLKIQSENPKEYYEETLSLKNTTVIDKLKFCEKEIPDSEDDWENIPDNSYNYILFSKKIDIHNYASWVSPKYCLSKYWEAQSIKEMVLIRKAIYEKYVEFLSDSVEKLKLWRLSSKEKLMEDKFLRFSVFNVYLYKHISFLDKEIRKFDSFSAKIYAEYAHCLGYQSVFKNLKDIKAQWEDECKAYESFGVHLGLQLFKRL